VKSSTSRRSAGPCATQVLGDIRRAAHQDRAPAPAIFPRAHEARERRERRVLEPESQQARVAIDVARRSVVRAIYRSPASRTFGAHFRPGVMERLRLRYDDLRAITTLDLRLRQRVRPHRPLRERAARSARPGDEPASPRRRPSPMHRRAGRDADRRLHRGMLAGPGHPARAAGRARRPASGQMVHVSLHRRMLAMQLQEASRVAESPRALDWARSRCPARSRPSTATS